MAENFWNWLYPPVEFVVSLIYLDILCKLGPKFRVSILIQKNKKNPQIRGCEAQGFEYIFAHFLNMCSNIVVQRR